MLLIIEFNSSLSQIGSVSAATGVFDSSSFLADLLPSSGIKALFSYLVSSILKFNLIFGLGLFLFPRLILITGFGCSILISLTI